MPLLEAADVGKSFGDNGNGTPVRVLERISFAADRGSVLVLRGPNGSGKTTLLNVLAGLEAPTGGQVLWNPPLAAHRVAYVFQNYTGSLLPWLTLGENISLPLRVLGLDRGQQAVRLAALAQLYDIDSIPVGRLPAEASGGQRQRACIARALLCDSPLMLLDEPFSALDQNGHHDLMHLVETLRDKGDRLIVMALHDLDDAILLADRLLTLGGKPASLTIDLAVDLPRPRTNALRTTAPFARLRNLALAGSDASI